MINYVLPSIVVLLNIRATSYNSIHDYSSIYCNHCDQKLVLNVVDYSKITHKCRAAKYNEPKGSIFNTDHENNNITLDGKYIMHKLN